MIKPTDRLVLYMEDALGQIHGKMGDGVLRYHRNPIVAIIDSTKAGKSSSVITGIQREVPIVSTIAEAIALGGTSMVLGIAPSGGAIPDDWFPILDEAVQKGLSLINGLHDLLAGRYPRLNKDQYVWDIRIEPEGLTIGRGRAAELKNRRVLMIGTDMAIGKMTAGLEIFRRSKERGISTAFVATGQIGITLTGSGIPLDAIRVDYAAGAVEREVLAAKDAEIVIVEGQGSLINPASSANLPLLRGSCPTHLVLCHRAGMTHLQKFPEIEIPKLDDFCALYETLGEALGVFARPQTVAVCLNTSHLTPDEGARACALLEDELGHPVVDPVRVEPDRVIDAILRP